MLRQIGIVLLAVTVLAVCGCGSNSAVQQPPPTPTPSPSPGPSAGSVVINSISPTSATAGSPDLTLTITGTNLAGTGPRNSRRVVWSTNGANTTLVTSSASGTQLIVVVPAALMTVPGTAQVFIEFGDVMGDVPLAHSKSVSFVVTAANTASISPTSAILGPKGIQQFEAMLNGRAAEASWSVDEGEAGGNISQSGLYTVPANVGTFHVTATFVAEPSKSATATIDVTSSGFLPTGAMRVARAGHTATLLNDGRVLILGGGGATAELFDPSSGTFSLTGPPVVGRSGATATRLGDGTVLIAGGWELVAGANGSLPVSNTAEIFNPATGRFSETGSMLQGRWQHTATLLNDGRVLIAGGYVGLCSTAAAELFDPATGTFSSALLLSERVLHTATLLKNGEVLMVGGSSGCRPDAADDPPWDPLFVELFEPSSKQFQAAGNMSTTRIGHATIRLEDGKVLVLGGIPAIQNLHEQPSNPSFAELYDPVLHAFSPVAGLTIAQRSYTATLLNSGMVLIAGGANFAGKPVADVDLLDPRLGALSSTGSLGFARVGHTATLLRDGRVLVTGGTDSNGNALASAEIYQ